ncbi:MAG TPA: lysylphosphatidylglycerol synthase transmembrane domain-containing protein [Candidatus Pristimantibacillus sp.]|nr:lysylphosphatidylglycerol synthase transmembrane domain-containing protein [Candidatus Pristimantibacillus sp.]
MGKHPFLRRNWRLILNIVTLVALAVLIFAIRDQLVSTFKNLASIDAWLLFLMVPMQLGNYHAQTKLYQSLFAIVGNKLRYGELFGAAVELNFVNHVFPSGGVSGISYFGVRMRRDDITGSRATLVQLMKLLLLFLSFEVLLVVGLLLMAIGNQANNFVILVTSSITTLMIVGTFVFVAIIGSEQRIHATFTFLTRAINKTIHYFRPNYPETISIAKVRNVLEGLHANYKMIESRWRDLKWPFFWALLANLTEVLTIYIVYLAFGSAVNLGAVILAYAVANFAGLVSILPGGIGIYETLMTGVLVAAGVPASLSIPVTVMYRVINTLLQIGPGYFLYHRTLHLSSGEQPNPSE